MNNIEPIIYANVVSLAIVVTAITIIFRIIYSKLNTKDNGIVHLIYVGGFAAIVIIALSTYICVGNKDNVHIIEYISFASTLSSLILSVIAIIVTIIYSKDSAKNNSSLSDAILKFQNAIQDFHTKFSQLDHIAISLEEILQLEKDTNKRVNKVELPPRENQTVTDGNSEAQKSNSPGIINSSES